MKLKSFNKINNAVKTNFLVSDSNKNSIEMFTVDYLGDAVVLYKSLIKRASYDNAKVLWCDPNMVDGSLMVGIEVN